MDDEKKKEIIQSYMKENSVAAKEAELSDKMRTAGLSSSDIQTLYRLPLNREALMTLVNNMILEKAFFDNDSNE